MKIKKTYISLVNEQMVLKTTKTKPIVDAIKNRNPISFYYSGQRKPKKDSVKAGNRIKGEVVAIGLSKKGNLIVRAYVQPPSVSKKGFNETGWRTFMVSRMKNIQIFTDEVFDYKRPGYKEGEESKMGPMVVTYATSDWGKQPKVKSKEKPQSIKIKQPIKPTEPTEPTKPTVPKEPTKPNNIENLPIPKIEKKPEIIEPNKPNVGAEIPPKDVLPIPKSEKKPEPPKQNNTLNEEIKRMFSLISY